MKAIVFFLIICVVSFIFPMQSAMAIEDPLSKPNNKVGIHILFDSELQNAAKLVNHNGDWGYVIIPIQSGDRDMVKWQNFLNEAKRLHVIPVLRLATEGDYFNTKVWRKPREEDILDFANFLSSLHFPTKNRYISVFNEVNRGDEWGGSANPEEYAHLLSYAVQVFKSKSPDFFIINAGLDNAAPNQGTEYIDQYTYMTRMNEAVPGIFDQIDGVASHSYPNPGFSQPPHVKTKQSITSFAYERSLIQSMSNKKLPIFITETGWKSETISDDTRAEYYKTAFRDTWSDPDIAMVAPFLLSANAGPFEGFSFLKTDGSETKQYLSVKDMQKVRGEPTINTSPFEDTIDRIIAIPTKTFTTLPNEDAFSISDTFQNAFMWIMKLN